MDSEYLLSFLCWDDLDNVLDILSTSNYIDVFYDNGIFFEHAISKDSVDLFKALMAYFEEKQYPEKNIAYEKKKEEIVKFLKDYANSTEYSLEMKESLSVYINFDDNSINSRSGVFDNVFHNSDYSNSRGEENSVYLALGHYNLINAISERKNMKRSLNPVAIKDHGYFPETKKVLYEFASH